MTNILIMILFNCIYLLLTSFIIMVKDLYVARYGIEKIETYPFQFEENDKIKKVQRIFALIFFNISFLLFVAYDANIIRTYSHIVAYFFCIIFYSLGRIEEGQIKTIEAKYTDMRTKVYNDDAALCEYIYTKKKI